MIKDILKKKKIKITGQRSLILSFILENDLVTLKDITDNFKNIDQSTIYRTLKLFEHEKIVSKIFNNHHSFYKFNGNNHKHYIECITCHIKQELDECPYNNLDLNGFIIKDDEIIKGVCRKCQKNQKIGIFVGSFNPPTKAHLEIGELLLNKKTVNKIIYVPCNNSEKSNLIDIKMRYKLLQEMIKCNSKMFVDDIKLNDKNKDFTYKDIDKLKNKFLNDIYIIIGSDNLDKLSTWQNYQYLLKNYYFIVINRSKNSDLTTIINKYKQYKDKFITISYNNDISSTKTREMISKNEDLSNVLDDNVIKYIKNNNLYQ